MYPGMKNRGFAPLAQLVGRLVMPCTLLWRAFPMLFLLVSLLAMGCGRRRDPIVKDCKVHYAVATMPTPILNTPDFPRVFGGRDGASLELDDVGLCRAVEVVALPGATFEIDGEAMVEGRKICRVKTPQYPYEREGGYFVDRAFLRLVKGRPTPRPRKLPHRTFIRYKLKSAIGKVYLWGGNWAEGIPEMMEFYPPSAPICGMERLAWLFRGVDCSGLLYEATNAWTPRNASSLIHFGKGLPIAGKSPEEILEDVKALDILGWSSHVMIFLSNEEIIQSRVDYDYAKEGNQGGVRIQKALPYLRSLMEDYAAVNDYDDELPEGFSKKFVIRRWYEGEGTL